MRCQKPPTLANPHNPAIIASRMGVGIYIHGTPVEEKLGSPLDRCRALA
jgi:hypothetical protein